MSQVIQIPDTSGLESKITEYKSYPPIATVEDYLRSAEALVGIKSLRNEIENTFDPIIKAANALTASIRKTRDGLTSPLDAARQAIENGRADFEERRAMERLLAESKPVEVVAELDAMGFEDEVSEVVPIHTPVAPELPKSPGVSTSSRWYAEVFDFKELVRAVADGKAPIECLLPNQPFINKMAQTSRTTMGVPGVRARQKKFTSVRA